MNVERKIYHQKSLREGRVFDSENPYFITICTENMSKVLTGDSVPEILIASIQWFSDNLVVTNLGFVIMPNHLHWVFALKAGNKLDAVVRRYKSFTANKMNKPEEVSNKVWQDGYYDHLYWPGSGCTGQLAFYIKYHPDLCPEPRLVQRGVISRGGHCCNASRIEGTTPSADCGPVASGVVAGDTLIK